MPKVNKYTPNFGAGELSPYMAGRSELPVDQKGVAKMENFIARPQGAVTRRTGTSFVNYARQNKATRLIPFQFSDSQAYIIEATDQKFRFYKDEAVITEAAVTITALAEDGTITSVGHGYSNGDEIFIDGLVGPDELNASFYLVANKTADTFTLTDVFGEDISFADLPDYISGGTAARVYEITTPYLEADLFDLQYAQNADTMYIAHRSYAPRKVTRSAHTSWTCATYTRTADPFGSAGNYPGAVCFISSGRLLWGGTTNEPETIWGSRSPQTGATDYDDYTVGTQPTSAFKFTLAATSNGKVDAIQWLGETSKFIIAGCYGSSRLVYGNSANEAVTPLAFQAKPINGAGAAKILPVINGADCFYVQRNKRMLRSLDYDFTQDGYETPDRNLVSEHLTVPLYKQIVFQTGSPDIIWAVLNNGRLLGMTYNRKEDIQAWHRHYLGGRHVDSSSITRGYAKVLSIAIMNRDSGFDQVWLSVERLINGNTVRSVEFISDFVTFPLRNDFATEVTEDDDPRDIQDTDDETYKNVLYESQKTEQHVDMSLAFDATSDKDIASIEVIGQSGGFGSDGLSNDSDDDWAVSAWFVDEGVNLGDLRRVSSRGVPKKFTMPLASGEPGVNYAISPQPVGAVAIDGIRHIAYVLQVTDMQLTPFLSECAILTKVALTDDAVDSDEFPLGTTIDFFDEQYAADLGYNSNGMVITADGKFLIISVIDIASGYDDCLLIKVDTQSGKIVARSQVISDKRMNHIFIKSDDTSIYGVAEKNVAPRNTVDIYRFSVNTLASQGSAQYSVGNFPTVNAAAISDDDSAIAMSVSIAAADDGVLIYDAATATISAFTDATFNSPGGICFPKGDAAHVLLAANKTGQRNVIDTYTLAGALGTSYTVATGTDPASALVTRISALRCEPNTGFLFGINRQPNTASFYQPGSLFVHNLNFDTTLTVVTDSLWENVDNITFDRTVL